METKEQIRIKNDGRKARRLFTDLLNSINKLSKKQKIKEI